VTSALSLPLVSSVTVDPTSSIQFVKKTEIKPENAKDGIQKMIKTGFIKSVGRGNKDEVVRALKSNQPHPKPPRHEPAAHTTRTKNQTPQEQKKKPATTRHEHDDEWYDDYFVSFMLCMCVSLGQTFKSPYFGHSLSSSCSCLSRRTHQVYHDDEYIYLMAELQDMLDQQQQLQVTGGNDDDDVYVNQGKGKGGKKGTKSSKKSKSSKKGKKGGHSDG